MCRAWEVPMRRWTQSFLQQLSRKETGEVEVGLFFEIKGVGAGALKEPGSVPKNTAIATVVMWAPSRKFD